MWKSMTFCLVCSIALTLKAQTINVSGKVTNRAGGPIANAVVTLVKQGLKDTTQSDGTYIISRSTGVELPLLLPQNQAICLEKDLLEFSLPHPSSLRVEIFDVKRNLQKKVLVQNAATGFYRFNIAANSRAAKLLVMRASIGGDEVTFRYLPLHNANYLASKTNQTGSQGEENRLARILAVNDTLRTSANGFTTNSTIVTSYNQVVNITLDSIGSVVDRSAGCGKTPTLTSGSRTIQSRSYMIRIPADYDKNHPYPLVFAFHWVGGTMNDVDGGGSSGYTWSYYGLREQADKSANSKMIFVAPQGISNGWANSGGQDVAFVDNMIKLIEEDLCVDTKRLFAMGFSYGGGMSYAIACARPKVFRAVAVYSGAVLSGCDGGKDPIAYIGIHGTSDGTCNISGGRSMRDRFVTNNGCTKPATVSEATGNQHVCYKYQGCKEGYPVEWCTFNGGHTPGNVDGGGDDGAKTWTKGEVWKFFTQF